MGWRKNDPGRKKEDGQKLGVEDVSSAANFKKMLISTSI